MVYPLASRCRLLPERIAYGPNRALHSHNQPEHLNISNSVQRENELTLADR
jgi:hypothetical protein